MSLSAPPHSHSLHLSDDSPGSEVVDVDVNNNPSMNRTGEHIENDFPVLCVIMNNLTSNFSTKNPHSLFLSKMFAIVDSLLDDCVNSYLKKQETPIQLQFFKLKRITKVSRIKLILPPLQFTLYNKLPSIILLKF